MPQTIDSKSLGIADNTAIPLEELQDDRLPLLKIGVINELFQTVGKTPEFKDALNNISKRAEISDARALRTRFDIPSGPAPFVTSS